MTAPDTITIDQANSLVIVNGADGEKRFDMDSPEAFSAVSRAWLPGKNCWVV